MTWQRSRSKDARTRKEPVFRGYGRRGSAGPCVGMRRRKSEMWGSTKHGLREGPVSGLVALAWTENSAWARRSCLWHGRAFLESEDRRKLATCRIIRPAIGGGALPSINGVQRSRVRIHRQGACSAMQTAHAKKVAVFRRHPSRSGSRYCRWMNPACWPCEPRRDSGCSRSDDRDKSRLE